MTGKLQPVMFEFTSPVTGAFPTLFHARKFRDQRGVEGKEAFFDLRFLFPPDHPDVPAIRAGLVKACEEAGFGGRNDVQWCLRDGNAIADKAKAESKDQEYFRGKLVLSANTGEKYPPGLGAVVNGELKDVPRSGEERATWEKHFFGGMSCLGQLAFKGYQVGNNPPTVKAYLQVVVSLGGTPDSKLSAGGAKSATAVFSKHMGQYSSTDPMAAAGSAAGLPI